MIKILTMDNGDIKSEGMNDLKIWKPSLNFGGKYDIERLEESSDGLKIILSSIDKKDDSLMGKARNLEKSGGYKKASEDFSLLNPNNTKSISTKYGDGKFGVLDDGTTISVRPGSETGGATLEIKIPGKRLIKIRY